MRLTLLFACCQAQLLDLNQYFYDAIKQGILSTADPASDLAIFINDLDDEKVLVYFETHLIPILVDFNKGGADWNKWDSVDISTAIINDDFRQAFNLTLEDDMIISLQIILQNGIERVSLLESGNIDGTTDSTILIANYGVAVIGIIDSMLEDLLSQDFGFDLPSIESYEQIISYVYSHFGFTVLTASSISTGEVTNVVDYGHILIELFNIYFPNYQGSTKWVEFLSTEFLPRALALDFSLPIDEIFDDASRLFTSSFAESLNLSLSANQIKIVQNEIKRIPDLIGLRYWSRILCFYEGPNLCSSRNGVEYFLQQTNIQVQMINDVIYRLTVGYTFEIDQSPSYAEIVTVVRGLRSAAWLSALSMKTSANREIELGKLIVQEEYFLTNMYGALSDEYDLGDSDENILRIKAIDTSASFENQAESFFQYADTYYNDTYDGEYYRMMVKPVIVLISEISSLQIPTDDVVWVLSDLISISGAVENLFAGQSEFNQGDNFPASFYQAWSYTNQVLQITLLGYRYFVDMALPDFNEIEKLIDTLLNENFAGDYTDASDELSKALRFVIEDSHWVPEAFKIGTVSVIEEAVGFLNNFMAAISDFCLLFNEEYEINYDSRVIALDQIRQITGATETSSTITLLVTNSIGLVENGIQVYVNLLKLI